MNKAVYLGMSLLDISKTLMYKFCYDYIKPKYGDGAKLFYTDTDSFIIHIITEDFYEDISDDVKTWFDTSNYDKNDKRPLHTGMNKKVIGLFKDGLGGRIMKEFCVLRAKTYGYLMDDDSEKKKAKGTEKVVIKHLIRFENYIDSMYNGTVTLRSKQRFKNNRHKVNKVTLSCNDDKGLQIFDRITSFTHRTNAFEVLEREMMAARDLFVENYTYFPVNNKIIL